jgi:hypothetical protein
MQGYNAQAAVTTDQIIVAAEITTTAPDYGRLEPVLDAALRDLHRAGNIETPTTVLDDAGYWHTEQMQRIMARGMQVLIPRTAGCAREPAVARPRRRPLGMTTNRSHPQPLKLHNHRIAATA